MHSQIPPLEHDVLGEFYEQTGGEHWREGDWLHTDPDGESVCDWYGVTCRDGHVTRLILPTNNLSGSLPTQLRLLSYLTHLDLSGNHLQGDIPARIGNLNHLRHLDLSENDFSGPLPRSLGVLVDLEILDLHSNQLNGTIPAALGDLEHLTLLDLSDNRLSGTVPPELGHLARLSKLNLAANDLSGPLPETLVHLATLTSFTFNATQLAEPDEEAFQAWLNSIPHMESTGLKYDEDNLLEDMIEAIRRLFTRRKPPIPDPAPNLRTQLQQELQALLNRIRGNMPDDVVTKVQHIVDVILEILPKIENINSSQRDVYVIRQTIRDYLPEALDQYQALPSDYARHHVIRDGKTAHDLLIEQLDRMGAEIETIRDLYVEADANALTIHLEFLEEKFREDEGWLKPSAPSPVDVSPHNSDRET